MQVFLSYARSDATAEADQLRTMLDNTRVHSWVDRHNLEAGENWWPNARKAIIGADAFVLLLTPNAVVSDAVEQEYALALKLHKHFLPILVKNTALPAGLAPLNYRDLTGANYVNGLTQVIGDLPKKMDEARSELVALRVPPAGAAGWKPVPAELTELVKDLEQQTASKVRPPEVFLAFSRLLAEIRDAAAARPLLDVLSNFLDGGTGPADWTAVIEEHRPYFTALLEPVRDGLLPQRTGKPVTVVLAVMTRAEALELQTGTAFANSPADVAQHFADLNLPANWADAYGATPEQWKPYPGSAPLGQLIRDRVQQMSLGGRPLYADFINILNIQRLSFQQLSKLRYDGCIVILDVVSIFHPKLHQAYLQSMLCAQQKALLVEMLPSQTFPELKDVTITFKKRLDLEFWSRYEESDNCMQIGRPVDLKRFVDYEMAKSGVFDFIQSR